MFDKVKSNFIMQKIFKHMRNKRKLSIIKYNKKILSRLDISYEHFEIYALLKEFNGKYELNLDDNNIKVLNLQNRRIRDEGLFYIYKIGFKELIKLCLCNNEITNINILEKINCKKLCNITIDRKNVPRRQSAERQIKKDPTRGGVLYDIQL